MDQVCRCLGLAATELAASLGVVHINHRGSTVTDTTAATISHQQQLVSDMKSVIADAEGMLHATAEQAGEQVAGMRASIQERLKGARIRLAEAEATLMAKTRAAARATDAYVHESPWTAVGVAAGVGLLLGLVLSRR